MKFTIVGGGTFIFNFTLSVKRSSLVICYLMTVSMFLVLISFPMRGTALSVLNMYMKIIFPKKCKNIFYPSEGI